ncbi:MAG: hypothetical protein FWE42_02650 [Defluviitaleaceae bacterium]|nr:hypothetical protein [Defluviitaleaceae bacterium]
MTKKCVPILIFILFLTACGASQAPPPPGLITPAIAAIHTDTAVVSRGPVASVSRHTGAVRTSSDPIGFGDLSASFGRFYIQLGDTVSQGQLLASLDFEHIQERINQQEEDIAALRNQHSLENRIRTLDINIMTAENNRLMHNAIESHDYNSITAAERGRWDIDRARMEHDFLQEQQALTLRHMESALAALEEQFNRSQLRAPVDGVVIYMADLSYGSWVAPFTTIMRIVHEDSSVFVEYIGGTSFTLHRAARVQAHINGQVYDATRIYLTREQAQRQPPLRFTLDTNNHPSVGSFASLYIYTQREDNVLRIPRNALHYDPDMGFYVHRIDESQLTQVFITIGPRTETYVAVLSGLEEGDVVSVRL